VCIPIDVTIVAAEEVYPVKSRVLLDVLVPVREVVHRLVLSQVNARYNLISTGVAMSSTLDQRIRSVEAILGFELRSYQDQALRALGAGKNVILHVPTGGGKEGYFVLDSLSEEVGV